MLDNRITPYRQHTPNTPNTQAAQHRLHCPTPHDTPANKHRHTHLKTPSDAHAHIPEGCGLGLNPNFQIRNKHFPVAPPPGRLARQPTARSHRIRRGDPENFSTSLQRSSEFDGIRANICEPRKPGQRPLPTRGYAAIVDRVTLAGAIIETGSTSYRAKGPRCRTALLTAPFQ